MNNSSQESSLRRPYPPATSSSSPRPLRQSARRRTSRRGVDRRARRRRNSAAHAGVPPQRGTNARAGLARSSSALLLPNDAGRRISRGATAAAGGRVAQGRQGGLVHLVDGGSEETKGIVVFFPVALFPSKRCIYSRKVCIAYACAERDLQYRRLTEEKGGFSSSGSASARGVECLASVETFLAF